MKNSQTATSATLIDLEALSSTAQGNGPQWGCASDDLNLTVLSWGPEGKIAPHVNNEVDVVLVGVEGTGKVFVNGTLHLLQPGQALLIPKGVQRAVESTGERLSYLSVHRRRAGLMPTLGGEPLS